MTDPKDRDGTSPERGVPRDPSPEQQLAARIWDRFRTDKRFPYVKLGMKLWTDGNKNMGQIIDALAYLAACQDVRSPWAVIMSAPVLSQALHSDMKKRMVETSRVDKGPQMVGELLSGIIGKVQGQAPAVQESAKDNASRNPDES